MKFIQYSASVWIFSIAVLIAAFFGEQFLRPQPNATYYVIYTISYIIIGLSMMFALRFNAKRSFFMLFLLLIVELMLIEFRDFFRRSDVIFVSLLLVPPNILLFSFLKERGIISLSGLIRILFLTSQIIGAITFLHFADNNLLNLIKQNFLPQNLHILPFDSATVVMLFTFSVLLLKEPFQNRSIESSFLWLLIAFELAFILQGNRLLLSLMFTASALIVIFAIIADSYKMAYLDNLTTMPARRALEESMLKLSNNYTIAMLDIDHFKKFNDTYGHDVGDDVLRLVAQTLKTVGSGGQAFRYGGEEFTILFSGKKANEVLGELDSLRQKVQDRKFLLREKKRTGKKKRKNGSKNNVKEISVTISIGVASSVKGTSPQDVIVESDKALYRAKEGGRNCVKT